MRMDYEKDVEYVVRTILEKTSFSPLSVSFETQEDVNVVWCNIDTPDSLLFLKNNKEGLMAVSFLCKSILEKKYLGASPLPHIIFDMEHVIRKEIEELWMEAHMLKERSLYLNKPIDLPPLNAFYRKLVHDYLARDSRIKTVSVGEGLDRHIVITPIESAHT